MSYRALASSRLAFAYEDNDTLDGDPRDSLEELTITLAPGLVAALASVPATCSDAQLDVADCPDAAVIGDGVAHLDGVRPLPATLYLMPSPGPDDLAGVGVVVVHQEIPYTATGSLDVTTNPDGKPVGVVKLLVPVTPNLQITRLVATMHATTADGKPFTRLPTSCATASSTATVVTSDGLTGSGQSSFVPTGCHLLAYAPSLTAVGVGEEPDRDGVDLTVVLTQPRAATESATRQLILDLPPTVVPIAGAVAACLNGTSCVIGSVTATSPLVTGSQLRRGAVTLAGSGTAPTVTLEFPEPAAFKITGTVDIASGIVTFADVPDLPFTEITVHVTGTSAGNLLAWTCTSGDLYAVFMPHSGGDDVTGRLPVAPAVCPDVVKPRPPRHPRLRVAIAARRALATGRRATLPLTCRGGRPRAVCRGTLSLTQRKRTVVRRRGIRRVVVKTVVLARANYGVRTGVTRRITLRLTNSGARMLASAKRGRLSVRATATLKGGRTAQRVITLQRGSRAR